MSVEVVSVVERRNGIVTAGEIRARLEEERVRRARLRHVDREVPALPDQEERFRLALARRDIAAVYRLLQRIGVSQRSIAYATGQSQSEVSEILTGRRVVSYDVLIRIADGLTVERGKMGLGYDEETLALLGIETEANSYPK